MSTLNIVLIVVVVLAVVFAIAMYIQRQRTRRLRGSFGPEYDRLVRDRGNQRKAEDELAAREKRVEKLHLRILSREEVDRFAASWSDIQTRFVDAPREAVAQAHRLVREVMETRGYPMGDFEQRAADISVDHADVVSNYRAAHELAARGTAGKATTEDLRQAMVHYRVLFEDLLGKTVDYAHEVTR
jgi:hypothetical protein